MSPTKDGYPTTAELRKISMQRPRDWHKLMLFIETCWWMPSWGWRRKGNRYYISTGGWSGNEEIIAAMRKNIMFWVLHWVQSRRGGHYIFHVRKLKK